MIKTIIKLMVSLLIRYCPDSHNSGFTLCETGNVK
jgi:hypothetical protein